MKPTKFDLMRAGRVRSSTLITPSQAISETLTDIKAELPAPTMEIDGVKYREVPEKDGCGGCEMQFTGDCRPAFKASKAIFGGDCTDRGVIYIRAE